MKVIAVIDFDHLDNGIFLNSFAQALARQNTERCIVLHADSEYTDRLMQTGMMREDARLRSIRDLNHRLIALFADNGVPTIGINGYQRSFIQWDGEDSLTVDQKYFHKLSDKVCLLLSTLVEHPNETQPVAMPVAPMAHHLKNAFNFDEVIVFSADEEDEILVKEQEKSINFDELNEEQKAKWLPQEFQNADFSFRVMNTQNFGNLPAETGTLVKA